MSRIWVVCFKDGTVEGRTYKDISPSEEYISLDEHEKILAKERERLEWAIEHRCILTPDDNWIEYLDENWVRRGVEVVRVVEAADGDIRAAIDKAMKGGE